MFGWAFECLRFRSVVLTAGALWGRLSRKREAVPFREFRGRGTGWEKPSAPGSEEVSFPMWLLYVLYFLRFREGSQSRGPHEPNFQRRHVGLTR